MKRPLIGLTLALAINGCSEYGYHAKDQFFEGPSSADSDTEDPYVIPTVEATVKPKPTEAPRGSAYMALDHCFAIDEEAIPTNLETSLMHELPLAGMNETRANIEAALILGAEERSGLTDLSLDDLYSGVVPIHVAYRMNTVREPFSSYYGIANLRASIYIAAGGDTNPFTGLDGADLEEIDDPTMIQCTSRAYIPEPDGNEPEWRNLLPFTQCTEITDGYSYLEQDIPQYWVQHWFSPNGTEEIDLSDESTYSTMVNNISMHYQYLEPRLTPTDDNEFSQTEWDASGIVSTLEDINPPFINDVFYVTSSRTPRIDEEGGYFVYTTSYFD